MPRTNNSIEGWHSAFKKSLGCHHPTIFKFIRALKREQSFQYLRIGKIEKGEEPEKHRVKYRKLNERILKIVNGYKNQQNFDVMKYLTSIAHNIHF